MKIYGIVYLSSGLFENVALYDEKIDRDLDYKRDARHLTGMYDEPWDAVAEVYDDLIRNGIDRELYCFDRPVWTTLTVENCRPGVVIRNRAHPNWGEFTVHFEQGRVEIHNEHGARLLDPAEFHFWQIVPKGE